MRGNLEKLCSVHSLALIYTNNKSLLLSSGRRAGKPALRVHRVFKTCPAPVAEALMNYFTGREEKWISIIADFALPLLPDAEYVISSKNGKSVLLPGLQTIAGKQAPSENPLLSEFHIVSIHRKEFGRNSIQACRDNAIKTSADSLLELDIIVDNPE